MISNWGEALVMYAKYGRAHVIVEPEVEGQLTIDDELYGQADGD